jgi:hypothetical protein
LNSLDAEAWMARCSRHLIALDPDSSLDGTDWDDIASDLLEGLHRLPPEWAAATYIWAPMTDPLRPEGLVRECACGSNNFERVVVHRPRASPYETDFIACAADRCAERVPAYVCPPSHAQPKRTPKWSDDF